VLLIASGISSRCATTVASQLVRHDLSGLATTTPYKPFKEAFCGCAISASLQINIYHFSILINSPPQILLLAIDLHENLINVERVTVSSLPAPQSFGIFGPKLDTPWPDGLVTNGNTALGQQVFNISVTQAESVVEPDNIADYF